MDANENYPSLINCLETGQNGLFLDLSDASCGQADAIGSAPRTGPFSETIPGCIKTDGDGVVQQVLLVLQRDRYDAPDSLFPLNNRGVEAAWQNAFAFHRNSRPAKAPIFFKRQINPNGEFEPLQPLFCCRETGRWFHAVCPECGLALTLCRDDALLEKKGLPSYSESLERFLYCGPCVTLSDSSPFFSREKAAEMPDHVHVASALVTQWKHLLSKFPDDADLPCRGCPDRDVCYGPDALVSWRIVPFRFYPFYMIMVPAPSCLAPAFIPLISGDTAAVPGGVNRAGSPLGENRFLFQDHDRQFLEILYLKLTFLSQVCRQLLTADDPAANQEFGLSLDGLGVDLNPPGTGLPAYWNFNVRILADNWKGYWKQVMHMGFELVDVGLKTGVAWDHGQFLSALDALRNQIRDDMFAGPAIASAGKEKTAASDKISAVLHGILQKWQDDSAHAVSQPILEVKPIGFADLTPSSALAIAAHRPL